MSSVVAVDVGGTRIRAALCDLKGKILRKEVVPTGDADVLNAVGNLIQTVAKDAKISGIGIGVPGLVGVSGAVHEAPNVPALRGTNLKEYLESRFGVPVLVDNDACLAGVGEHRFGAGRNVQNMAYITVSTGIGGCAISGGKPVRGVNGFTSEVGGQVFVDPERGFEAETLEKLAAGPAIVERVLDGLRRGRKSSLQNLSKMTCEDVVNAAKADDDLANEVLRFVAFRLGLAVVNVVSLFNPEVVVLGGGVMNAGDLLLTPIRLTVDRYVLPSMRGRVRIVLSELGDDAGLRGAAALIIEKAEAKA